jgi:hypothetical protein
VILLNSVDHGCSHRHNFDYTLNRGNPFVEDGGDALWTGEPISDPEIRRPIGNVDGLDCNGTPIPE